MNSRRSFLKKSGLFAASVAIAPSFAFNKPAKAVGVQLYSLRDIISKDVKGVIEKVAAIGYKEVETYGYSAKDGFWGLKPKEFSTLLKQNGLVAPSGHYDLDGFMSGKNPDSLKSYIEAANVIGSEYIIVPYLGGNLRSTADHFAKLAAKLNEGAELCKKSGLKFGYHNHDFEFKKFGNTTGLEIMLKETDKKLVDFELDLYWAVRSGVDPSTLFKAYPGRFKLWHVKDMDKINKDRNTEVGNGAVNFKSIFEHQKLSGVKHFYVEHETNYKPDILGSVRSSFNYVKKELL